MLPELSELYRDHAASVWRYVRSRLPSDVDAEDVTSDVFARAMRSSHTYAAEHGSPRAWLVGIARHATADWWRRRRPEAPGLDHLDPAGDDDPTIAPERADTISEVRRLLEALTDREREALSLRFAAELSSPEIGEALGISPTAARMLVHRAVSKLRGVMADG